MAGRRPSVESLVAGAAGERPLSRERKLALLLTGPNGAEVRQAVDRYGQQVVPFITREPAAARILTRRQGMPGVRVISLFKRHYSDPTRFKHVVGAIGAGGMRAIDLLERHPLRAGTVARLINWYGDNAIDAIARDGVSAVNKKARQISAAGGNPAGKL